MRAPHRLVRLFALFAAFAALTACSPPPPVKIGYLGTLSGRSADSGLSGRNGALLAVEEINAAGGVRGRQVQLVVRDDGLNSEITMHAVEELAAEKVEAIVGPVLSSPALVAAPVATRLRVPLVSPTATANELLGREDMLFRLSSPTSDHAKFDAGFHFQAQGRRRIAVAYELGNRIYTEGYLKEFRDAFTAMGGQLVKTLPFEASAEPDLAAITRELGKARPDAMLFIANALDTARLAQHARRQWPGMPLIGVAWAGSEDLIELGGRAVEGMHVSQYFDREDQSPAFVSFKERYQQRFGDAPSFFSTAAYDATRAVLSALARRRPDQSLANALLTLGPFPGTQRPIVFDRFGDAKRPTQMAVVRNNRLVAVPWP